MKRKSRLLFMAVLVAALTAVSAIAQTPPVASDGPIQTTPEDTAKTITLLATDFEGDPLTYTVVSDPFNGILSGTPPDLTYQPAADYSGPDSFTFKVNDGSADSNTATVSITVTPVNDAPAGTVKINVGKPAVTRSTSVLLTLTASDIDGVGPIRMCISNTSKTGNTAPCSTWTTFVASSATMEMTKSWTITSGSGNKTVKVWFRDQLGKISAMIVSDPILLDTTAPANGKVTAVPGDKKLTLNWSPFADNPGGSGTIGYRAVFNKGTSAPSCTSGTPVPGYLSPATTLEHTLLVNGTTYAYRVCAVDAVGNMSSGATVTGKPVPETDPPDGEVTIKALTGSEAATRSTSVKLTIRAEDNSVGAIRICISNSNTAPCSAWSTYTASLMSNGLTRSWTLPAGSGYKNVYVWFRDIWGNTSATPVSDTILLDTIAPTNGKVETKAGISQQLTLSWSEFPFVDNPGGSGITGYRAVFNKGTSAPASCTSGTPVPGFDDKTATTLVHVGLLNGATYAYRVCAMDEVGNMSSGATKTGKPADTAPPTGTVTINGGAAATRSTLATLTLTAADDGGGALQMCISNTATCSSWTPFAASPSWTLATGSGTATVNVWFRDKWGNTTATPYSDTIVVDTTPTGGTVTINGGAAATNSTLATLTLTAADAGGGAIQMCISNTAACSTWTAFEATKIWTLAVDSGTAIVNVWYRDQLGNTSATPNSDTILLDMTAPTDGTVTAAEGITQQLTLSWSGFDDTEGSGITAYRAVFQEGSAPPSCSGTTVPGYAGTGTTLVHTGLVNGTTYGYRVCAIDAAGNISSGATVTGQPVSTTCEECHNGNPDHPLAPNVMTYWDGSWWDSNQGGNAATQQGGHGDPDSKAAVECTGCHDISLPAGYHQNGILESTGPSTVDGAKSPQNVNENTAHLKAAFIALSGGQDYDAQVTFDKMCSSSTTGTCHNINSVGEMRHARDTNSTLGQVTFGEHLTDVDGNALPTHIPIDSDLTTNKSTANPDYAPCVSCHDPHGTGDCDTRGSKDVSSNKMLRYDWANESSKLCRICH